MSHTTSQAKRITAGFGYSYVMIGNTTVYTTKIRTKQFGLLRYAIEHHRNTGKLQGMHQVLRRDRKDRPYVTYEFVTTDLDAIQDFRKEMDIARAEVLSVKALRLLNNDPSYMPEWMQNICHGLHSSEGGMAIWPNGTEDLQL